MSDTTTQARGLARQVASVLKGQTGIYATLAREHGEVDALLEQALSVTSQKTRGPLLEEARVELLSHARAEERTLYKALEQFEETRQLAASGKTEHDQIVALFKEICQCQIETEAETAAIERLRKTVQAHVLEEEEELFVQADAVLDKAQNLRLEREFTELKSTEKRQLESDGAGWAKGPVAI